MVAWKVLQELADVLEVERNRIQPTEVKQKKIQFVRQSEAIADG